MKSMDMEWKKFEKFDLPFTIVYDGPLLQRKILKPLDHGFTHMSIGAGLSGQIRKVPPSSRAINWTGIAYHIDNPWKTLKSPWGNDIGELEGFWNRRFINYARRYGGLGPNLDIDILVLDIEANLSSRKRILELRSHESTPASSARMSADRFIELYNEDMFALYSKPLDFATRNLSPDAKISSYGDVPVQRNWHGIDDQTWEEWQAVESGSSARSAAANHFYDRLAFLSTSSYYFYKSDRNLAYCLFQIEANKAVDSRPIIQFVWMRHTGNQYYGEPIRQSLAEATAIFPFFSGADGLWLWEQSKYKASTSEEARDSYHAFIRGLERLGAFSSFFDGYDVLHIPKSARDHFVDRDPIWRAVVKGDRILVAAQNPYAEPHSVTELEVSYGSWSRIIRLEGDQILLEEFPLSQ